MIVRSPKDVQAHVNSIKMEDLMERVFDAISESKNYIHIDLELNYDMVKKLTEYGYKVSKNKWPLSFSKVSWE